MAEATDLQQMRGRRPAAVAGLFYPREATALRRAVEGWLRDATVAAPAPKALIAPHAGYAYSGPVAASAFEQLRAQAQEVTTVVLLGPSHRVPLRGAALPPADRFVTPLGEVEIDLAGARSLLDLPQVRLEGAPHAHEHSLEVELPFLQAVLGTFRIIPLVVGMAEAPEVAEILERVWGGRETRIVISSDLSHFLDYAAARRADERTSDEILGLRGPLTAEQACGAWAINGLLEAARTRDLRAELLDLRSSGDTAGDRGRVVGYGAFCFREAA